MTILWPLDDVRVTGEWANSPEFYEQFGQKGHNGIDLAAAVGTPVFACDAGVVDAEGWGANDSWMGEIAGLFVRLRHWWGFSAVAHLSVTQVDVGQSVARGQQIALSGATGVGTGPHAHFETFPVAPNFGNGFAGRINPRQFGLELRGNDGSTPNPKPEEKNMIIAEEKSSRTKLQQLKPGIETRIAFNDKNHTSLVFGPLKVVGLFPSIRLKAEDGARVVVRVYREKIVDGKVTSRKILTEQRAQFDRLGLASLDLSTAVDLGKDWRVRVTAQTSKYGGPVEVQDFRWSASYVG